MHATEHLSASIGNKRVQARQQSQHLSSLQAMLPALCIFFLLYRFVIYPCRTLTTPTEDTWKGVTQLQDYKNTFPKWTDESQLQQSVKQLDSDGLDLLKVSFIFKYIFFFILTLECTLQYMQYSKLSPEEEFPQNNVKTGKEKRKSISGRK